MQTFKRLLALILITALTVMQLPVLALTLGENHTNNLQTDTDTVYDGEQGMVPASIQYSLGLRVELDEIEKSVLVQMEVENIVGDDAPGGILVTCLYVQDDESGISKLVDFSTAEIPGGVFEDGASMMLSSKMFYDDVDVENLVVNGVVCRSLDEPLPLSEALECHYSDFELVPVSLDTLDATDITKTSVVLNGKVEVEDGTKLNASDFGFIVLEGGEEAQEELDEEGNPIGVSLPDIRPAERITSDGYFSLTLTGLGEGSEIQYMAVKKGKTTYYGQPKGVVTNSDVPIVETHEAMELNSDLKFAKVSGKITDNKGFGITESGIVYGTDPKSALTLKATNNSGNNTDITATLEGLSPGQVYYYRAYAKTSGGIGYGKTLSFTMPAVLPQFANAPVANMSYINWTLSFSATIASDGGSEITERGFRYKRDSNPDWKYIKADNDPDSNVFTAELAGQYQLPIGNYTAEAYMVNSVGMVTMSCNNGATIRTDQLVQVSASIDSTSVTVTSAVLKGNIVDAPSISSSRGFEYRAVSESNWIDAGVVNGGFVEGPFSYTLEGLQPYTRYVYRAKAYTYAGWSYSPEVYFTTVYSDNAQETAYQMKKDGKTALEITQILYSNMKKDIKEICASLKFAGFSANEVAAAFKENPVKATYTKVIEALAEAGFDGPSTAKALKDNYESSISGDVVYQIVNYMYQYGFSIDEIVKAQKEAFGINLIYMKSVSSDDLHAVFVRVYGAYAYAKEYWEGYDINSKPDPTAHINSLAQAIKVYTHYSAGDIAAVIKEVYPPLTSYTFITCTRSTFPTVSEMGDAVMQALGADPTTAAIELSIYSDRYPIDQIKAWLIHKHGLNAQQMVEVIMDLPNTDPLNTIPVLLKDDLKIVSATDAAKAMYEAGWKENESSYYGYWRVLRLLIDHYDCTSSDLINIMKDLGFSAQAIARQLEALKNNNYISAWQSEYRQQGYAASDLAAWYDSTTDVPKPDQAVIIMGQVGYSLDEITLALKQVYDLDANAALTILQYDNFINTYRWWTEAQAMEAVDFVYNVNPVEDTITGMKESGATAVQIAKTLKENFAVTSPDIVADYLIELGYGKNDVLTALAQSFRSLKNAELIQMLSQIIREKFSEEPMDNMRLILNLYESVKGKLNHTVNGIILLYNSGFSLSDITYVLKNDIDALENVADTLTAFEAGCLLLGMKAYGLTFDKHDIFKAVEDVYGANFMLETVVDFRINKGYSADTAIIKLDEDFDIDSPSAAALCLKAAGYTMEEILAGLEFIYHSEKELFKINLLSQVLEIVYPEEQAPMKAVMNAMMKENPGIAAETLYRAGYSLKEIITILQHDYEMSSPEVTELLYERNFQDIVISVEDVYGGNGYLDFILYRKNRGDSITQLFDWLYKRLGVTDVQQIINTLKLVGFTNEDIITLLYEKRKVATDETVLQVQEAFGIGSISEFLALRKSRGDNIDQAFNWLQKFGVKNVSDIISHLTEAGYSQKELIEFLFKLSAHKEIDLNGEDLFEKNTIVSYLKERKAMGENITQIYNSLYHQFAITNIAQIANYLHAVGYSSTEILDKLFYEYGTQPDYFGEIIAAVQSSSRGTDVITEYLQEKKQQGESILLLYNHLKVKFIMTDLTQIVQYLKAVGYTNVEIIEFLYQEITDTSRYGEIIAAVQAANAVNGTDVILEFLRNKKVEGKVLHELYSFIINQFTVSDTEQIVSLLKAIGYTNNEIIDFWSQLFGGAPSQYEEIIQATQAASGTDVVLDFLVEKKNQGENIYLIYNRLSSQFSIIDISRISSYLMAVGYNSSEVLEFLFMTINDQSRYGEIVAAVQAANASSGNITLEYLQYLKSKGDGLFQLYNCLIEKMCITDLTRIATYLLEVGYSSNEIIDFLYRTINDQSRYEEIVAAVQAARASSGGDLILEYLRYLKSNGDGLVQLYNCLIDKMRITDLTRIATYLLGVGYSSNQLIDFLYNIINDQSRYEEIVAAVQAARASSGGDVILEYLQHIKNQGMDIVNIYFGMVNKFGINDVKKILNYLKDAGYTREEVIAFAFSGYANFKEMIIASAQNHYGDDSILQLLTYRKSQGDSLAQLYSLLTQLNIIEAGQIAAYFKEVGFADAEITAFFNERKISMHNQIITFIQECYANDVILDYLLSVKSNGGNCDLSFHWLTVNFGLSDTAQIAWYLNQAGYVDNEIIIAIDRPNNGRKAITALKGIYGTETPVQLLVRLLAVPAGSPYTVHDLVCGIKSAFPDLDYPDIIRMVRESGKNFEDIVLWLRQMNENNGVFYLGLSKDELDRVAAIIGKRKENDLHLDKMNAMYVLLGFNYTLEEAVYWAKYANFESYEIYFIGQNFIDNHKEDYKVMLAMEEAGCTLIEIAEAVIASLRKVTDDPNYQENYYSLSTNTMNSLAEMGKPITEVAEALVHAGIGPRYVIYSLYGYWYKYFYWKDPKINHYPHTDEEFTLLNMVTWVYNAVSSLPDEEKETINMVEETAAALYKRRDMPRATNVDVFEAMMFITGKMSLNWREKLPQSDIDVIDDLINTIASLISFPGQSVNNILDRVLVVNAMRIAGYDNDEATDLLKAVVGSNFMMNFAMQAMGGYNAIDAWNAVMRVDAYRVQLTINIAWTIACNAYRLDAYYKVINNVKKYYDKLKKICMFLIDHNILKASTSDITFSAYGELDKVMTFGMTSETVISDVTLSSNENGTVAVRGSIITDENNLVIILVKKPAMNGSSQKSISLNSLTDEALKEVIDYFGCVNSTDNFELQYRSDGIPGEYTVIVGTIGAVEPYTAESVLFGEGREGYVLSLSAQLNEQEKSVTVIPDIVKFGGNTDEDILIIALYENNDGVYSLIDIVTRKDLKNEDALELSFEGFNISIENLVAKGMIWDCLDSISPKAQYVVVPYSEMH